LAAIVRWWNFHAHNCAVLRVGLARGWCGSCVCRNKRKRLREWRELSHMQGCTKCHQLPDSGQRTRHVWRWSYTGSLCEHTRAPSRVLAMAKIALNRVCPIASAKGHVSGASRSTFGKFRRLGIGARRGGGARVATDRRPLDRDVERLFARKKWSGMIQHTQQAYSQPPRPQGGP